MKNPKRIIASLIVVIFILSMTVVTVNAATDSIYYSRGTFLLWSKTTITWTYNGTKITDSECNQDCGNIMPNLIDAQGASKYAYGGTTHYRYTSKYKVGSGIPTPWGDAFVYSFTQNDVGHIYANGAGNWE